MYTFETQARVRYGETDKMGYLYYGNYALLYEVGRVEAIRSLGISYKALEDMGILMPVLDLHSSFVKPAYYDDLLTIRTSIVELPSVRAYFRYEIINQAEETINLGKTTLIFFDGAKKRPCRAPDVLLEKLAPFFTKL